MTIFLTGKEALDEVQESMQALGDVLWAQTIAVPKGELPELQGYEDGDSVAFHYREHDGQDIGKLSRQNGSWYIVCKGKSIPIDKVHIMRPASEGDEPAEVTEPFAGSARSTITLGKRPVGRITLK